jgi:hypothetical protein
MRIARSHEESLHDAREYMRETFGNLPDLDEQAKANYYARWGLLSDFIDVTHGLCPSRISAQRRAQS